MDLGSKYTLADAMPEVFKPEVWQDERPHYNRTAAEAVKLQELFKNLGPAYSAGLVAAVPDAMQGPGAPALLLDLVVAAGYGSLRLNYEIELKAHTSMGTFTIVSSVGEQWNTLDGPQGSATERLTRVFNEIVPGAAWSELLLRVDPFAQLVDQAAASLLAPFQK